MKIRLLATDLDFTLLDENRAVSDSAHKAIQMAHAAGIQVVLASGRIATSMEHFAYELGLSTPLISCNGAYVLHGQHTLAKILVSKTILKKVVDICLSRDLYCQVYTPEGVFFPVESEWSRMYLNRVKRADAFFVGWSRLTNVDALKMIILAPPDKVRQLSDELGNKFLDQGVQSTVSEPEYFELLSSEASKGKGLEVVAKYLGIQKGETASIGDYFNDVSMLEWSEHSAAVENAPEEVRNAAKWVAPKHSEGGVEAYVRYLIDKMEQTKAVHVRP